MDILAALDGAGAKADNRPLNAPPEKLDYAHVDAVDDVEELAWILGTLRRGVHGRYPDVRSTTLGWLDWVWVGMPAPRIK